MYPVISEHGTVDCSKELVLDLRHCSTFFLQTDMTVDLLCICKLYFPRVAVSAECACLPHHAASHLYCWTCLHLGAAQEHSVPEKHQCCSLELSALLRGSLVTANKTEHVLLFSFVEKRTKARTFRLQTCLSDLSGVCKSLFVINHG